MISGKQVFLYPVYGQFVQDNLAFFSTVGFYSLETVWVAGRHLFYYSLSDSTTLVSVSPTPIC